MSSVPPHPPTLQEVAARAGVSRATVSRVINDSPRVSPQARAAVQEAIDELRYVPNRAARSLVTRRTDTIALVLSEPDTRVFSDPFFASIVRGVSATLASTDLTLVLLTARGAREQEKVGRYVRQGHVDGVVLMSLHNDDLLPTVLNRAGVPLVLSGRPMNGQRMAFVDADNVGGAAAATEYLLSLGRTHVGTVAGPGDMIAGVDRQAGYRAALERAGYEAHPEWVQEADFTEDGGFRATTTLLGRVPDLDALFVASDPMAAGALRALRAAGRQIPGDVAVVGFDDAAIARTCDPALTTISQPLTEMAQHMSQLLLRQIDGVAEAAESRIFPTRLVRRDSA